MGRPIADSMATALMRCAESIVSIVKILTKSHKCKIGDGLRTGSRLIIMGNGPSLRQTIENHRDLLHDNPLLAVNFAANAKEFPELKPDYYVLADPVFFEKDSANLNVIRLHEHINGVSWKMVLFVPFGCDITLDWLKNPQIKVYRYNCLGVEGADRLCIMAFRSKRGMPRPRNVLIPSLMIALWMGYKEIYLTGADHSWTKTLKVDDSNRVISVQPHFYEDSEEEKARISAVYENVRLHEILDSFRVAFKSYFDIKRLAELTGAKIINATSGSFIDAFERGTIDRINAPS